MSKCASRSLRPYLFNGFRRAQSSNQHRAFIRTPQSKGGAKDVTHDYEKRVAKLQEHRELSNCYPRLEKAKGIRIDSIRDFRRNWDALQPNETHINDLYTLYGRIESVRTAGSKLLFLELRRGGQTLQATCNLSVIATNADGIEESKSPTVFKSFAKLVRKGDWYSVTGHPHRTPSGELGVHAIEVPQLLSPSLHQVPEALDDAETRARSRHVDMLVNPETVQTLLVRDEVDRELCGFLAANGFTKVQTPFLTAGAGGAVARPFETEATELQGETLNLRIAPELWLKRLVVGGLDRVFEVGPAFRNEGVDATHNPEFTICEFYAAFADLEWLMRMTEELLRCIAQRVAALKESAVLDVLQVPQSSTFDAPFHQLEFLPTLELEMETTLPPLSEKDGDPAIQQLITLMSRPGRHQVTVPSNPSLPRLLDALAAHYIEPLCQHPTFITHHPACLSPLSKHFTCPQTSQVVAARAELFIAGREYANMYEEENSPFEQRRKLTEQLAYRGADGEGDGKPEVDESYLEALEWGLPPTGGWGCGVDRVVMLMSGRQRIGDVLAFGTLRNVVGLGSSGRRRR